MMLTVSSAVFVLLACARAPLKEPAQIPAVEPVDADVRLLLAKPSSKFYEITSLTRRKVLDHDTVVLETARSAFSKYFHRVLTVDEPGVASLRALLVANVDSDPVWASHQANAHAKVETADGALLGTFSGTGEASDRNNESEFGALRAALSEAFDAVARSAAAGYRKSANKQVADNSGAAAAVPVVRDNSKSPVPEVVRPADFYRAIAINASGSFLVPTSDIADCTKLQIADKERLYPAQIVVADEAAGVAVVSGELSQAAHARFRAVPGPRLGAQLQVIGYFEGQVVSGRTTLTEAAPSGAWLLKTLDGDHKDVEPGALIFDQGGAVAGLVVDKGKETTYLRGLSALAVRSLLDAHGIDYEVALPDEENDESMLAAKLTAFSVGVQCAHSSLVSHPSD